MENGWLTSAFLNPPYPASVDFLGGLLGGLIPTKGRAGRIVALFALVIVVALIALMVATSL